MHTVMVDFLLSRHIAWHAYVNDWMVMHILVQTALSDDAR